ncbi:MAG: DUF4372 domain-containing protein [Bacteroidales bacterium]
MDKSTYFFGQLNSYIDNRLVAEVCTASKSDHYVKRFTTKDHLISMPFCSFAKCTSMREVSGAMLGLLPGCCPMRRGKPTPPR